MADQETTQADVDEAVEAKRVAGTNALELEQRLMTGDDSITAGQLEAQKSAARYAVLQVQGVRAKLAATREAKRLQGLSALKDDVDAYTGETGAKLADLLQAWYAAEDAFVAAAKAHDATVQEWTQRANALDAKQSPTGVLIEPGVLEQVQIGRMGQETLIVGRRRIRSITAGSFMGRAKGHVDGSDPGTQYRDQTLAHLRSIDAEADR